MSITRRSFVSNGMALGALPLFGAGPALAAEDRIKLTYATLKTGISVIINENLKARRPDLDNGLDIQITNDYTSVSSYYSDFISGTFELGIGAWETYLRMYERGVPAQLVSSITTGTMINIVAREDGPKSVDELKGKTIAANAASGAYNMCKAVLQDTHELELGKDITIQNVPSPAQAMTLLMSGNVDAALSWEPNVSAAMARMEGLQTIFNLGKAYQKAQGLELPYFAIALRSEAAKRNPEAARRLNATFAQLNEQINANLMESFTIAAPELSVEPETLMRAYEAGRLEFVTHSMLEPQGRDLVRKAQEFVESTTIADGFFAS